MRYWFQPLLLSAVSLLPLAADAEETQMDQWVQADGVTGNWAGNRARLEERGIHFEAVYTGEFVRNATVGQVNGRKDTAYHDNLDLTLTLDTGKADLWQGGTLFLYGLRTHGAQPSANTIGDLQVASNIEGGNHFLLQEAWYEQQFFDGGLSVLGGLHDLNSEFDVSENASLFLNSSFGIGAEISNVATSLFPRAGLGLRVRVQPTDAFSWAAAVYDGDPATRKLASAEGHMVITEAAYQAEQFTFKAGAWQHTANVTYNGQAFGQNQGYYAVSDIALYQSGDRSVGMFVQYGQVPKGRNDLTPYKGAGLNLSGMIPGRADDQLGIAVANAKTKSGAETVIELTYHAALTNWLSVQPSLQWINNPGGATGTPQARVGLLRFEVAL